MSYVALYRKFRPQTFDEVKGQEHITETLRNQVKTGRLQHAYLFCGTRGTGKTSVAKILARAVNCEHPENGNPCGKCESCRDIASGKSMNVIEIDAASNNGVENIRQIIEEVQYRPAEGKYKVYIIDEVHMLSTGAFNALLKTLEEPPEYVIFILATTEVGKVPITILSRCQRYDFHRISVDTIAARMGDLMQREGVKADAKALRFIARTADGSMRDALSLLDRCIAFYMDQELTYEKVLKALGEADTDVFENELRSISAGDAGGAVRLFERQVQRGTEIGQFVTDFIWYLRNLLLVASSDPGDAREIVDASEEQLTSFEKMAADVTADQLIRYIRVLSDLQGTMRYASNRRVPAEIALIRMAKPEMDTDSGAVLDRIRVLEEKLEKLTSGAFVQMTPAPAGASPAPETDDGESEPLPDAAPEDIKAICKSWDRLVHGVKDGLLRTQLERFGHVQYNTDAPDNVLHIAFDAGPAANVVMEGSHRADFEKYLERQTGRHVEVRFHSSDDKVQNLKNVRLKSGLDRINFEITEE